MAFLNKLKKFNAIRTSVGFIVVGAVLLAVVVIVLLQPHKETVPVNATITAITISEDGDSTDYSVTVTYTVNGQTYTSELGAYQTGWEVGDVLECKYNAKDPSDIGYGNGNMLVWVILVVSVVTIAYGIHSLIRNSKKSVAEYAQYDRIGDADVDPEKRASVQNNTEEQQSYVFHFTDKMNQSFVMEDSSGNEVFRADCNGITLVKATDFTFVNAKTGSSIARKIGHTVTSNLGGDALMFANVSSSFKIDGLNCWDFLKEMGYGFDFSLNGIKCHYEVRHYGVSVGSIEIAGTEAFREDYKGNPLARIPTNGIFNVTCQPSEVEGFFYICFCITKTDTALD